ncbi:hypothetical protein CFC21_010517 [Triticum aestivum]|uniref:Thioesterase domain-containing protein n=2 Tax=Triticum aestivum TaxID=4565 RepID=A0A9R1DKU7_WHEAT|nr:hypothetical protein CFC21_010517 [Triticum aestivum]
MAGSGESARTSAPSPPGPPPGFGEGAPPDNALHALGFEYTRITGTEVLGRLAVTETCCQVRARVRPPPPPDALPDHMCMYLRRDRLNQLLPSAWSQPFKILNGGVSALMAESTASIGGYMASGYRRVAGVQLSINHLKPARLGDRIEAKANPIQVGRNVQVWEVQIWLLDPSTSEHKDLVSSARVTLLTNLSTPEEMKSYEKGIKKYAKL